MGSTSIHFERASMSARNVFLARVQRIPRVPLSTADEAKTRDAMELCVVHSLFFDD